MNELHTDISSRVMVLAGAGGALAQALAERFMAGGYTVIGLSRTGQALRPASSGFTAMCCDLTDAAQVRQTFDDISARFGRPSVVIHSVGGLLRAPFLQIEAADFERVWRSMVLSAMLVAQAALKNMPQHANSALLFSGATASLRGGANFAAFASAKFALRGLAQSLAREYQPQGIHVAHVILDGLIGESVDERTVDDKAAATIMQPSAIAESYWMLAHQTSSAWTHELDLRPSLERF